MQVDRQQRRRDVRPEAAVYASPRTPSRTQQKHLLQLRQAVVLEQQEQLAHALVPQRVVCLPGRAQRLPLRSRTRSSGKIDAFDALSEPRCSWFVR